MKKVWIMVSLLVLIIAITIFYNWNRYSGNVVVFEEKPIKNDWVVLVSVKPEDTMKVIEVKYQEKYGLEKTAICKAVFENSKTGEYKCISPEIGSLILQKSNLNSFNSKIVFKDSL